MAGGVSGQPENPPGYATGIGKTSKRKVTGAPRLKYLPPTSEAFEQNLRRAEAFEQNVRRAHFQVSVWKAALENDPPELAPTRRRGQ